MKLCKHSNDGLNYWLCFHFNGKVTPGSELKDNEETCKACTVKDSELDECSF